jgi:hypothetical protein
MTLRHRIGEQRMLYIVHACALKGVMFGGTLPLSTCPRKP